MWQRYETALIINGHSKFMELNLFNRSKIDTFEELAPHQMRPLYLFLLLLPFTVFAQKSEVKKQTLTFEPQEEGFKLSLDIGYAFGYCPDGLNVFIIVSKEYIDVSSSSYLYQGKWYSRNDVSEELAQKYFDKKHHIGILNIIADVYHGNSLVTQVTLGNVTDFGGLGCFGQTYCVACQGNLDKEASNSYRTSLSDLELRNIRFEIGSAGKCHLSYELSKVLIQEDFESKLNQAIQLESAGDKEGALAIYKEITGMSYSSVTHEKKTEARNRMNELRNQIREEQKAEENAASQTTADTLVSEQTSDDIENTDQALEQYNQQNGDINNVSKVDRYNTIQDQSSWNPSYAMQSWDLFTQSEMEMQNRFDQIYEENQRYSAFVSGLRISNELTPEAQLNQYRQKLNEIESYYQQQMADNLRKAEQFGQENAGQEGAAVATMIVAGAAVGSAKMAEKDAKRQLELELTRNFRSIQKELLAREEPYIQRNKDAAARSISAEREQYYLNWVRYWECRVSRIKNNFSIYNTDWIDPSCSAPSGQAPNDISSSTENLRIAAKRKHGSSHDFLEDYADRFIDLALSRSPKDTELLYLKYLWNREKISYWTSIHNPARKYLDLCLRVDPSYAPAKEALLWELANDDHLRSSYVSYLNTYPTGIFSVEARWALSYFDTISSINQRIENDQLWSATLSHKALVVNYRPYYNPSDIPQLERLRPIYAEMQWLYVSDKKNYEGYMGEGVKLMLQDQYNFIDEYPKLSRKFPVKRTINTSRNKLAGSTFEYQILGLSPYNSTTVTSTSSYYDFNQMEVRDNLPITYSGKGILNSITLLSGTYKQYLFTISGPLYVTSILGMKMGPFMLNRKIQLNEEETDAGLYQILSDWHDDPIGYSQEYMAFPERLYYMEPVFKVKAGLSLSNIVTLYHLRSEAPQFGGFILESGASVYDDPVKSDNWGENMWNDVIFPGGWGLQLDLPLAKNRMVLLTGVYELMGNKNWEISDYPYRHYELKLNVAMFYLAYSQSSYDIRGLSRGGIQPMQDIRNINVRYSAFEFGLSLDFNMVSKQNRSVTTKKAVFD